MFSTKYPNNSRVVSGTPQLYNDDSILLCNTSGAPVTINLLSIPAGKWNTTWKLYVCDNSNNASVNNITINAGAGQLINGAASVTINVSGGSALIRITDNTKFVSTFSYAAALGNGHIIQDEGIALPQQPILNFVGAGVTVTDAGGKTVVTIPGSAGVISLTNAALVALIGAATIIPGQLYLVTDANLTNGGAIVQGVTTTSVSLEGAGVFLNPDYQNTGTNNVGVWYTGLVGLVAGVSITIYNGLHYLSVTGAVGTAPDGDAVNWLVMAKTIANTYVAETDFIRYDATIDRLIYRADKRENEIEYTVYKFENSLVAFQWGNNICTGNKALGTSFIGNINNRGTFNFNSLSDRSVIEARFNAGTISHNSLSSKSTLVATNNLGIVGPVSTAGGDLGGNVLVSGNLTVTNQTAIGVCAGNTITSGGFMNVVQNESELYSNFIHSLGAINLPVNQSRINRCEIGAEITFAPSSPNLTAFLNKRAVSQYSNFPVTLDMNDPAIYNGGTFTLTIPGALSIWAGIINLTNSNKTINKIVNLSNVFPTKFYTAIPAEVTTFRTTAVGFAAATDIVAAEAPGNKLVTGRASGTDNIEIEASGTFCAVKGRPNIYQ
jgi:hypothetical protein